MTRAIGIDGCRGGWFAVIRQADGWRSWLSPTLTELLDQQAVGTPIFIDIPIGLPDGRKRRCDHLARRLLSPYRHSSVFSTPVRDAVHAADYASACMINAQQTGNRITRQTWNICPKIREVDHYLRQHAEWQTHLYESHPEVAFYALNGQSSLPTRKKSHEGQQQRLALLTHHIDGAQAFYSDCLARYPRKLLQPDDILDAMVLAVMADRAEQAEGELISLTDPAEHDRFGLPMRIVYRSFNP